MSAQTPHSVREAADILGIGDSASIIQIRTRYHTLARMWHPDVSDHASMETHDDMVCLNAAYDILIKYCMQYQISFHPDDLSQVTGADRDDDWMDRFGDDPIWGPGRPP